MKNSYRLLSFIYFGLFYLVHKLIELYFIQVFKLPSQLIIIFDICLIASFSARLLKRKCLKYPFLKSLIKFSLMGFGFFSLYLPGLLILYLIDIFFHPLNLVTFAFYTFVLSWAILIYEIFKSHQVKVKIVNIPLSKDKIQFAGLKIVHLSDFHLGPTLGNNYLRKIVTSINSLQPDIVVITGDLIDGPYEVYKNDLNPLENIYPKIKTFFITGNHEYYYDSHSWISSLESMNINVLKNKIYEFKFNDSQIGIGGIDDLLFFDSKESYLQKLDEICDKLSLYTFNILLNHRSSFWQESSSRNVDLQLSGHTHGGQSFPWKFFVQLSFRYFSGLYCENQKYLYVHEGNGHWGPPVRFLTPAHLVLINFME